MPLGSRDSEAWVLHALELSGAGVWAWSVATDCITADGGYRRLYGFKPDERLSSASWQNRLYPDDCKTLTRRAEECLATGNDWHEEFRILHPERGERWLEGQGRVVFNSDGEPLGLAGLNTDITERKHAEIALRDGEVRLRAIIENVIDGIIAIDKHGIVDSFNPAAERIFGYSASDVVGHNVRMLMPEPHQSAHDDYIRNYMTTGKAKIIRIGREVTGLRKDGTQFPLDLGISEFVQNGRRMFIGIVRDITERKEAEDTQRLLIDEINHRVKNTLVTVQAMAEQTLRQTRDPQHFIEGFRGRLQSMSRAHNLLTNRKWTGVDFETLIRDQLLIDSIDDPRITCRGPQVQLDARLSVHVGLVLHELGTNARKYGALKHDVGRLNIAWSLAGKDAVRQLHFTWTELGVPAVSVPESKGFGTLLIERGIIHALGGSAQMSFTPNGLRCELGIPMPERLATPVPGNSNASKTGADNLEVSAPDATWR